jgi:hypothetical protein
MAPESFIPLSCLASTLGCLCRRFYLETITLCKILQISLRNRIGVIVITGAGISTSCDIPDFRSECGLYSLVADKALPPPPSSTPSTPSNSTLLSSQVSTSSPTIFASVTNARPGPIRRKYLEGPFCNRHVLQIHCLAAPDE